MPNANDLTSRRTRGTIQSVDRAARILKALASGPRRLGVLAARRPARPDAPDRPRAAADAAGARLRRAGPRLRQVPARRRPAAPRQLLPRPQRAARALARPRRAARAPRAQAAVRVGVLHGAAVVVVHHVFRPDAAFQVLEVGAQLPAHASALGKAMLAYAPDAVLDDLTAEPLAKLTQRTLTAAALRKELKAVRESGLARERDEAVLGESSLAAPIHDSRRPRRRSHRRGRRHRADPAPRTRAGPGVRRSPKPPAASRASSAPGAGPESDPLSPPLKESPLSAVDSGYGTDCPPSAAGQPRLHADRAPGGDPDHRDPRRDRAARVPQPAHEGAGHEAKAAVRNARTTLETFHTDRSDLRHRRRRR